MSMTDAITLTNAEGMELNSRPVRAEDARRARLILPLADGHTWDEASVRIECSHGFLSGSSKRNGNMPIRCATSVRYRLVQATSRSRHYGE